MHTKVVANPGADIKKEKHIMFRKTIITGIAAIGMLAVGGTALAEAPPLDGTLTYNLNANKLNKQQVMNFFKLWVICIGPTNDE